MGKSKTQQKKKQFYRKQQASSKRGQEIKGGLVGFLATCDQHKEKRCVKELFNLLNDFTEKVYPELDFADIFAEHQAQQEVLVKAKAQPAEESGADTGAAAEEEVKEPAMKRPRLEQTAQDAKAATQDIMKGLQDEIAQVKKAGNRLYYVFDMQVPGAIFIKLADWARPHVDVKRVGQEIVEAVKRTGELTTRFVCRLIPVDFLCKANNFEDFKTFARPALKKHFPMRADEAVNSPATTKHVQWCLEFKRRNNEKFQRKAYVDYVAGEMDPRLTSVSYDYADVEIVVEIFRDMLVMAVLPGYKTDFKKYNLQMLAGGEDDGDGQEKPAPVKVADLIKMRKEAAAKPEENKEPAAQAEEEDEEQSDGVVYKPKIDILDQIEAEKKAAEPEESSEDDGPQLI